MNAVIYIRVSDRSQMRDGHGLESQELRCEQFCLAKGYEVKHVFKEEGVSGGTTDRPQLKLLFGYLQENKGTIVVIDDLKRLSRSVSDYLLLTEQVKKLGCSIEYINHTFEDSPEGEFIQVILAGAGQLERKQNARAVKQKQKARLELGYWCIGQLKGYKYQKVDGSKLLVPDETAAVVKEVLEGFANQTIKTHAEILSTLKKANCKISKNYIGNFLKNPLYAGWIDYPEWEVPLTQGKHQALISWETHRQIINLLESRDPRTLKQGQHNELFTFRRFVECEKCHKPLTAQKIKGKNNEYHSYYCYDRNCKNYRLHFNGIFIQKAFLDMLNEFKLTNDDLNDIRDILTIEVNKISNNLESELKTAKEEVRKFSRSLENKKNLIDSCEDSEMFKLLSEQYKNAKSGLILASEKALELETKISTTTIVIRTQLDLVLVYLKNIDRFWAFGDLVIKKTVFETVFNAKISMKYDDDNKVVLTPQKGCLYDLYRQLVRQKKGWCNFQGVILNTSSLTFFEYIIKIQPIIERIPRSEFDRILTF